MRRKLIVNADDFGRSPGVSRGILQAHQEGIVTSTTVMINQPGVEEQLASALAHSDLGIGLHLVFTAWRPILPPETVPSLVSRGGAFLDQHTVWARAQDIVPTQLCAELSCQVDRFVDLAGRLPDHMDCHHFVHLYPPFFEVYVNLAVEHGLPLRVPFPAETDLERALDTLPFLEGFPRDLVRAMVVSNSTLLEAGRVAHPDHFVSTFFGREALTLDHLFHLLDSLPAGVSELMCHPGFDGPALSASSYRAEREIELALLTDPAVRQHVETLGIELVTFDVLG
jgi:predicted glycoside hydrolase/deacetylase ChbG (UPF0249 family)